MCGGDFAEIHVTIVLFGFLFACLKVVLERYDGIGEDMILCP